MNSNDHLGEVGPGGHLDVKGMVLTQCFCDTCRNSFYVEGKHTEFLPQYCCYCGGEFYKTSDMDEPGEDYEDFLWM